VIYAPTTPLLFLLLLLLLGILVFVVEVRVLSYAYRKIGIRPRYVFAVLLVTLVGSHVNVPLYAVRVERLVPPQAIHVFGWTYIVPPAMEERTTVVAINVGGALVPILVSLYLLVRLRMYGRMLVGTLIVALITHRLAAVVPGVGIAVPMFLPPLVAAGVALALAWRRAPPVAYVAGCMGTLLGADVANLGDVARLAAPVVSIGGAGTFDGVFLTGIIAGLLV